MTEPRTTRVALLGLGAMGEVMRTAFTRSPGWELAAVADPAPGSAERVRDQNPGAAFFADSAEAIARLDALAVDAVAIATTPASHESLAVAALAAGRHVLCEKPLALDGDGAARMAAAAASRPGQLAVVDLQSRFMRSRAWLRDRIAAGDLGTVRQIEVEVRIPRLHDAGWSWWSQSAQGGGMLNEFGSHSIDLLRWLLGATPRRVSGVLRTVVGARADATGALRPADSDDVASFRLEWDDGCFAQVNLSGIALPPDRYLRVHGDAGSIEIAADDMVSWHRRGGETVTYDLRETEPSLIGDPGETYSQPFARLAEAFREAIQRGQAPADAATFADGLAVARIIDAIRTSARVPTTEVMTEQ